MNKTTFRLVLGSQSPRRLQLLAQIGITPDVVHAADIDETERKGEMPGPYALRVAREKNEALASQFPHDFILTADTTVSVGTRILGKAATRDEAEKMVRLLSGRAHRVYTAVVVRAPDGTIASRVNETRVKVKRMTNEEIAAHLDSNEWEGCAGSYKFQGGFARHIIAINGAASGIIGLPLFETSQLLNGLGYVPAQ